ncbi:HAD family hydrolase, partial [Vibrio celticus]|uniref:HAD family hydrolase n=1 Tax=Vibrio celticus TaxID=446372 RepID=UPI0040696721
PHFLLTIQQSVLCQLILPQAIAQLKSAGIHTVLLTGDYDSVAQAIGKSVGIDEVNSEVLPEQKAQHIVQLQQQYKSV